MTDGDGDIRDLQRNLGVRDALMLSNVRQLYKAQMPLISPGKGRSFPSKAAEHPFTFISVETLTTYIGALPSPL